MKKEVLDYLKSQRVGVLAVEMLDGSPHAATMHFAHTEDPLLFYFETSHEYRKTEPLFVRETTRASLVIGSSEEEMKTLQLDGTVQLLKSDESELFDSVYFKKFPDKREKYKDQKLSLFKFVPTWWRFTDWTTPQGKTILTSE